MKVLFWPYTYLDASGFAPLALYSHRGWETERLPKSLAPNRKPMAVWIRSRIDLLYLYVTNYDGVDSLERIYNTTALDLWDGMELWICPGCSKAR